MWRVFVNVDCENQELEAVFFLSLDVASFLCVVLVLCVLEYIFFLGEKIWIFLFIDT